MNEWRPPLCPGQDPFPLSPPPGRKLEGSSLESLSSLRGRSSPGARGASNRERHGPPSPMSRRQSSPSACSASVSGWRLSQRSPGTWAKDPDRRDVRNFPSGRWEDAHSDFCSTVTSSESLPRLLCLKPSITLYPSLCLISEREDREMEGRTLSK